jgi:alkanesulfonate monooxygenase SsuD/methylene tetrahydromethanopterin reductase-like flavin-dependent oxidoreductase (luciferase family)
MLAVFVICAETDQEAQRLAASIDLRRYQMSQGVDAPIATTEEALRFTYSEAARTIVERERARAVIGTPDSVKARLAEMQARAGADELIVVTITGDYASRLRSYELLAHAFALPDRADVR